MAHRPARAMLLLAVATLLARTSASRAACNVIPEAPVPFRGARGTIDRAFVQAGDRVKIGIEGTVAKSVDVAIVPPSGAPFFIAGDDRCDGLVPRECFLTALVCHRRPRCITGADAELSVASGDGGAELGFRFPDIGATGPIRVVIGSTERKARAELATVHCAGGLGAGVAACIGALAHLDPTAPAHLVALAAPNDFQTVCWRYRGGTPHCKGGAGGVRFTLDESGNVVIAMRWRNIGAGPRKRALRGSSSIDAFAGLRAPIVVPSAEFLDSSDLHGTPFGTRPFFIPEKRTDRPLELTLLGHADKGESVLRIFRRRLWDHVCTGGPNAGQACEAAPQDEREKDDCPGARCAAEARSRFFACAGGARDGLPCTRPHHCGEGRCLPGSVCYTPAGAPTAKACSTDADCGAGEECGRGLFDLRNRPEDHPGTIAETPGTRVPGVCDLGDNEGARCTSTSECNPRGSGARCVAYRGEALDYVP